ncbi:class I SAM-dependent methyltransferase [Chloroflexota bacterium]
MIGNQAEHWNQIASKWNKQSYTNKIIAEHKRNTYLRLIKEWANLASAHRILKTDLFAEAFGPEQFLFYLAQDTGSIVGIDISYEVVLRAMRQAANNNVDPGLYLCGDVRALPFQDGSFDLIISDSTLDHFPTEIDIINSLKELWRVLVAGGSLILTIDNKSHLTYPPYVIISLSMKLGLLPYFVGRTLSSSKLTRVLEDIGFDVERKTAVFHYPHPDALVRWSESTLRKISRGKLDNIIRKGLACLDRMEGKRLQYLTGRYLAVKAVKKKI